MLTTSYKRPTKLSGPNHGWSPGFLNNILEKSDAELDGVDYRLLFGPHLPAGRYDEIMYFLPIAFDYLRGHNTDKLEMVSSVFGFCSNNAKNLEADGLLDTIVSEINECLNTWSNKFEIVHFDEKACLEKEWTLTHMDYVKDSEVILEGTTDLVRFESLKHIAVSFYKSIALFDDNQIKASWFLELSRSRFGVYTPPECEEISTLLTDKKLLNKAYDVVYPLALDESVSPTYWKDTFNQLSL